MPGNAAWLDDGGAPAVLSQQGIGNKPALSGTACDVARMMELQKRRGEEGRMKSKLHGDFEYMSPRSQEASGIPGGIFDGVDNDKMGIEKGEAVVDWNLRLSKIEELQGDRYIDDR